MAARQASLFEQAEFRLEATAGVDEAGRGCLAGPVVAAAVILPPSYHLPGLDDSKKIPESRRESLSALIKAQAIAWAIGMTWPRRIEKINILKATMEAMAQAVSRLAVRPELLLIDGNRAIDPALWDCRSVIPRQRTVIHGDALIPVISAASILAKTARDALMKRLDVRWPQYGFRKHKGYGTAQHYAALAEYGPSPLHRRTFRGVASG